MWRVYNLHHTSVFTYSHANTPLGQSERAYYLNYFIKRNTKRNKLVKFPSEYPFKDQRSANKLLDQPIDLSEKINIKVHSVFTSHGIKEELKAKEPKRPIVNQQKVVLLYTGYVFHLVSFVLLCMSFHIYLPRT